jgi:hypothetical protein
MVQGKRDIILKTQCLQYLETWLPVAADDAEGCTKARVAPGERDARINGCTKRDSATLQQLEATSTKWAQPVANLLRTQLSKLNSKYGNNVTSLVPVWGGILDLRTSMYFSKLMPI